MKRFLPFLLIASLCGSALATTYVRVEKDGSKTYSDRPIPGGVEVELKPAQGYSAPPTPGNSTPSRPGEVDDFNYQSCAVSPANDTTFTNPDAVPITLSASPALRGSDTVTMTVDGQAVGDRGSFTLEPADRGTHTVAVTITSQGGRVLCSSTSVFHVMRPGLNSPMRPGLNAPANRPRPTPH